MPATKPLLLLFPDTLGWVGQWSQACSGSAIVDPTANFCPKAASCPKLAWSTTRSKEVLAKGATNLGTKL